MDKKIKSSFDPQWIYTGLTYLLVLGISIYILYERFAKGSWFYTHLLLWGVVITVAWQLSFYGSGKRWDKWVTFFIWIVIFLTLYGSWYNIIYLADISWKNPFVLMYFSVQLFFFTLLLVSRYTSMNLITVISWMLGLFTVFMVFFTINMWSTVRLCEYELSEPGIQDPFWITTSIYLGWLIVIGSLFAVSEMKRGNLWYFLLALGIGLSIWIVGYTLKRCSAAEKKIQSLTGVVDKDTSWGEIEDKTNTNVNPSAEQQAEIIATYDEVSWIGTSIHILTIVAYFSFFIGQFFPSAWYAFMGYYILDGCSPEGDPRRMAFSALLILLLPIAFMIRSVGGIMS